MDLHELRYYLAKLRKDVVVPAALEALSQAMQLVDWHSLVNGKHLPGQIDPSIVLTAFDVLGKLQGVGAAAALVQYKYWIGRYWNP